MVRRRKKEIARQYFIYAIEFDSIVSPSDCFKFRLSTPQPNEPFFQMTFGWKSQREKKHWTSLKPLPSQSTYCIRCVTHILCNTCGLNRSDYVTNSHTFKIHHHQQQQQQSCNEIKLEICFHVFFFIEETVALMLTTDMFNHCALFLHMFFDVNSW